jgi:ribulose-phosphate 3-epimerase
VSAVRIYGSIRSVDPTELGPASERLLAAGVDGLHVDLSDGVFVPELGFGPAVARALVERTGAAVEVHLMVVDPERYVRELAEAGVARISFHLEAAPYPWRVCSLARSLGLEVGLAANPATTVEAITTAAPAADFVNLLTSELDYAGERLLPGMVERAFAVRAGLPAQVRLEADGGVDADAARALAGAGVEDIVAGRAITGAPDWSAAVEAFRDAADARPGALTR